MQIHVNLVGQVYFNVLDYLMNVFEMLQLFIVVVMQVIKVIIKLYTIYMLKTYTNNLKVYTIYTYIYKYNLGYFFV